jgi:hypothetical protein
MNKSFFCSTAHRDADLRAQELSREQGLPTLRQARENSVDSKNDVNR